MINCQCAIDDLLYIPLALSIPSYRRREIMTLDRRTLRDSKKRSLGNAGDDWLEFDATTVENLYRMKLARMSSAIRGFLKVRRTPVVHVSYYSQIKIENYIMSHLSHLSHPLCTGQVTFSSPGRRTFLTAVFYDDSDGSVSQFDEKVSLTTE